MTNEEKKAMTTDEILQELPHQTIAELVQIIDHAQHWKRLREREQRREMIRNGTYRSPEPEEVTEEPEGGIALDLETLEVPTSPSPQ
jgi:hypothetical protein